MKTTIYLLSIVFLIVGCGTHGEIKSYKFNYTNDELVSIVDGFLLKSKSYSSTVNNGNGWIYIQDNNNQNRFGFRVGGKSLISLISAGKNGKTRWDKNLGYFEKKRFIKSFEENFIEKIKSIEPRELDILRKPFTLSKNKNIDTIYWRCCMNIL